MPKDCFPPFKFASFSSISDCNIKQVQLVQYKKEDQGLYFNPGINLKGICKNSQCSLHQKSVYAKLGFGEFHMGQVIRNCLCPLCGKKIKKVEQAIIYKCQLLGKGEKVQDANQTFDEDQEEVTHFDYLHNDNNTFIKWGELQSEIIQWYYLVLKTSKPTLNCPGNHGLESFKPTSNDWICDKCNRQFKKETRAKSCRECDYDVCYECI